MTGCTELDLQDMTDRLTALIRFWEIEGYVITGRILCFTGPEDLVYLYIRNGEIEQKHETVKVTSEESGLRFEMADDLMEDLGSIFAAYGTTPKKSFIGFSVGSQIIKRPSRRCTTDQSNPGSIINKSSYLAHRQTKGGKRMALYVTGDTHGADRFFGYRDVNGYIPRLNMKNYPGQKVLTKDDIVIICGDFGSVWDVNQFAFSETSKEKNDLDWLDNRSFTTLVVPGNHENYDRLTGCKDERLLSCWYYEDMPETEKEKLRKGYPRKEWNGGMVRMIRPSVLMAEPGVFDLCGYKCFCYGGAGSHDIQDGIIDPADFADAELFSNKDFRQWKSGALYRIRGVSWWSQEQPGPEQEEQALQALYEVGNAVDFIFTHDAPLSDSRHFSLEGPTRINLFLQNIKDTVSYRHWYFGHYHDNVNLPGGKDHLIYEQIIRLV